METFNLINIGISLLYILFYRTGNVEAFFYLPITTRGHEHSQMDTFFTLETGKYFFGLRLPSKTDCARIAFGPEKKLPEFDNGLVLNICSKYAKLYSIIEGSMSEPLVTVQFKDEEINVGERRYTALWFHTMKDETVIEFGFTHTSHGLLKYNYGKCFKDVPARFAFSGSGDWKLRTDKPYVQVTTNCNYRYSTFFSLLSEYLFVHVKTTSDDQRTKPTHISFVQGDVVSFSNDSILQMIFAKEVPYQRVLPHYLHYYDPNYIGDNYYWIVIDPFAGFIQSGYYGDTDANEPYDQSDYQDNFAGKLFDSFTLGGCAKWTIATRRDDLPDSPD